MLAALGPVTQATGMFSMLANHLLKKDDIGIQVTQMAALIVYDQPLIEAGKSFVDIVSDDM